MKTLALMTWTAIPTLLLACTAQSTYASKEAISSDFQETLQLQLLDAKAGDVITIPDGKHYLNRSLSLTVDGVTIRGAGMDKSILSFKDQIAGAEGLLVTANNFTLEDVAIEDTKGDALKAVSYTHLTLPTNYSV